VKIQFGKRGQKFCQFGRGVVCRANGTPISRSARIQNILPRADQEIGAPNDTTTFNSVRWTFGPIWIEMPAMIKLSFPLTEEKIRALKVGDEVLILRVMFTGREMRG
jgi:hypothetical protein